jgi:hypothetical protein
VVGEPLIEGVYHISKGFMVSDMIKDSKSLKNIICCSLRLRLSFAIHSMLWIVGSSEALVNL